MSHKASADMIDRAARRFFGESVTLIYTSAGAYVPGTGTKPQATTQETVTAVWGEYQGKETRSIVIGCVGYVIVNTSEITGTPKIGDRVVRLGTTYEVVQVDAEGYGEEAHAFRLHLKGA